MSQSAALIIVAVIAFALVPFVPQMMRLRIRVLRFLHWGWMADLHENHFVGFVLAVRMILIVGGLVLLALGLSDSRP